MILYVAVDLWRANYSTLRSDPDLPCNDYYSPLSNGNLLTSSLECLQCLVDNLANIGNSMKGISSKISVRYVCM